MTISFPSSVVQVGDIPLNNNEDKFLQTFIHDSSKCNCDVWPHQPSQFESEGSDFLKNSKENVTRKNKLGMNYRNRVSNKRNTTNDRLKHLTRLGIDETSTGNSTDKNHKTCIDKIRKFMDTTQRDGICTLTNETIYWPRNTLNFSLKSETKFEKRMEIALKTGNVTAPKIRSDKAHINDWRTIDNPIYNPILLKDPSWKLQKNGIEFRKLMNSVYKQPPTHSPTKPSPFSKDEKNITLPPIHVQSSRKVDLQTTNSITPQCKSENASTQMIVTLSTTYSGETCSPSDLISVVDSDTHLCNASTLSDLPSQLIELIFQYINFLESNSQYKLYFDNAFREIHENVYSFLFNADISFNPRYQPRSRLWILYRRIFSHQIYTKMLPIFFGKKNNRMVKLIQYFDAENDLVGIRKCNFDLLWASNIQCHWYSLPIEFSSIVTLPKSNILEFSEWLLEERNKFQAFKKNSRSPPWSWSIQKLKLDLTLCIDGKIDKMMNGWGRVRRILSLLRTSKGQDKLENSSVNYLRRKKCHSLSTNSTTKEKNNLHFYPQKMNQESTIPFQRNRDSNKISKKMNASYSKSVSYVKPSIRNDFIQSEMDLDYNSSDSEEHDTLRRKLRDTKEILIRDWDTAPSVEQKNLDDENLELQYRVKSHPTSTEAMKESAICSKVPLQRDNSSNRTIAIEEFSSNLAPSIDDSQSHRHFPPMKNSTPIPEQTILERIRFIYLTELEWLFQKISFLSVDEEFNGKEAIADLVFLCTNLQCISMTRIREPSQRLVNYIMHHDSLKKICLIHCSEQLSLAALQNVNITSISLTFVNFDLSCKTNKTSMMLIEEIERCAHLKSIQIHDRNPSFVLQEKLLRTSSAKFLGIEHSEIELQTLSEISPTIETLLLSCSTLEHDASNINRIKKSYPNNFTLMIDSLSNLNILILIDVFGKKNSELLQSFCRSFGQDSHSIRNFYMRDELSNDDAANLLCAQSLRKTILKSKALSNELPLVLQQTYILNSVGQYSIASTPITNRATHNLFNDRIINLVEKEINNSQTMKDKSQCEPFSTFQCIINSSIQSLQVYGEDVNVSYFESIHKFFPNAQICEDIDEKELWNILQ